MISYLNEDEDARETARWVQDAGRKAVLWRARRKLNSYERVRILPELEAAVSSSWAYDPGAFLTTNCGHNAIYTGEHARPQQAQHCALRT